MQNKIKIKNLNTIYKEQLIKISFFKKKVQKNNKIQKKKNKNL